MNTYKRHRFPPEIISYAVWLYHRFNLSHRDIEDLLAERGIAVSHESIRLWCIKFGPKYARRLKRKHRGYGDTFYIDEVFRCLPAGQARWGSCKAILPTANKE
jgi:putative transposase